jgi:tRNA-specific 2-thiouridylase
MKKVFVGLSGGVDSAVSAALLKERGFDVTGVFILIKLPGYPCPAIEDRQEAMRVAAHLRIPFREIDLSKAYEEKVFAHALAEFARGRTPNPDTLCNREIKFGLFFDYAMAHGADYVATGHYAQLRKTAGRVELCAGADEGKDQSYFLWMVPDEQLAQTIFPIGDLEKTAVRTLAASYKLPNATRKDSQGLCFLGDISLTDMLEHELHPVPGVVLSEEGECIGTHNGAVLYTLGQRHGFTLQARSGTPFEPQYVIAKDIVQNTLTVSPMKHPKGKKHTHIRLVDTNWIGEVRSGQYAAQYRYHQAHIPALATIGSGKDCVELSAPYFVPLGQSLVLFDGRRCLGGGIIDEAELA